MNILKIIIVFLAGFLAGAIILYGYLWYQVLGTLEGTWCQVYTGELSVDQNNQCQRYKTP